MFSAIYIEEEVRDWHRVQEIIQPFTDTPKIICERYGEIFNNTNQNFRIQKKAPALILAKKYGNLVLPSPGGYGFEGGKSFYFSHMLNCIYDCRYCFLQGMYRSANYVLFVNYDDFESQIIENIRAQNGDSIYYSGYDCDSLALEPVSQFCEHFLHVFEMHPDAILEIRTKSTQVRCLLGRAPIPNCIVAMSFSSQESTERFEHKVPTIKKRIQALKKLQGMGWQIAIRFEPIIFEERLTENYRLLFEEIFHSLDVSLLHSVSLGEFRMPKTYYKNIVKLYPDEQLFGRETKMVEGMISLKDTNAASLQKLEGILLEYVSNDKYYLCG